MASKFVDETDMRIELRKASDSLSDTRHTDEHQAGDAFIEDRLDLLKTINVESVCLIHDD
jgi:hypothetical protein